MDIFTQRSIYIQDCKESKELCPKKKKKVHQMLKVVDISNTCYGDLYRKNMMDMIIHFPEIVLGLTKELSTF